MKFLNIVGNMNHFLNAEQVFKNYVHFQENITKFETGTSFNIHKYFFENTNFFYKIKDII